MRDFLVISLLLTMLPAAGLACTQFFSAYRWTDAALVILGWTVFPVCYWWPLGFWLLRPRPHWLARVAVGYLFSVPLYFICLFVVYAASGFRFHPTGSTWTTYLAVSPWFFLYTVALWLLVRNQGRLARATRACAIALFIVATTAPLAAIALTDRFPRAASAPRPSRILNARIVDTLTGTIVDGKVIHLEGGVISAITDMTPESSRAGADAIDARGAFLVPGLIDVHVHLQAPVEAVGAPFSPRYFLRQMFGRYPDHRRQLLAHGITSVRDLGGAASVSRSLADDLATGQLAGPRLFTVARLVTSPTGHPIGTIWTPQVAAAGAIGTDDAGTLLSEIGRDIALLRPDAVKIVYGTIGRAPTRLREDLMTRAIRVAADHRLPAIVHAERAEEIAAAVRSGATGIEHVATLGQLNESLLMLLRQQRPFVDATFGEYRLVLAQGGASAAEIDDALTRAQTNVKRLFDADVPLVIGTDAPLVPYGSGLHDEFRQLQRAGLTPWQVLRSATIANAAYLGRPQALGRIAEGFKADVVLVRDNPLERLDTLRAPLWTMVDGFVMWQTAAPHADSNRD
jgi:imidazolonepropionase-like amidohydrolase